MRATADPRVELIAELMFGPPAREDAITEAEELEFSE